MVSSVGLPGLGAGAPASPSSSKYAEEARAKALYRLELEGRLSARKDQAQAYMKHHEGEMKGGIFFSQSTAALRGEMYRLFTQQPDLWQGKASDKEFMAQVLITVRERYARHCSFWRVKPNSRAISCIEGAEIQPAAKTTDQKELRTHYNFSTCNLGDRGTVCVLLALAHDPFVGRVSLRGCGLRQACAPVLAEFVKLHPNLEDVDLEDNNIGYAAGNLLMSALRRRERRSSIHSFISTEVNLNLATTPLSFGRCGGPPEPPCGFIDTKTCSAEKYKILQKNLDDTGRVRFLRTRPQKPDAKQQFDGI